MDDHGTVGKPYNNVQINTLMHKSELTLKTYSLEIMNNLLKSEDKDNRTLGANYILGVLTIVSQHAANSLPWLYNSFLLCIYMSRLLDGFLDMRGCSSNYRFCSTRLSARVPIENP